jgi:elongation factor G
MKAEADEKRNELIEHLSNADETLGMMYLGIKILLQKWGYFNASISEEKVPTEADIMAAVRRACIARTFTPVMVGTALKNKGVQPLLDGVLQYLPSPKEVDNFALKESHQGY